MDDGEASGNGFKDHVGSDVHLADEGLAAVRV